MAHICTHITTQADRTTPTKTLSEVLWDRNLLFKWGTVPLPEGWVLSGPSQQREAARHMSSSQHYVPYKTPRTGSMSLWLTKNIHPSSHLPLSGFRCLGLPGWAGDAELPGKYAALSQLQATFNELRA